MALLPCRQFRSIISISFTYLVTFMWSFVLLRIIASLLIFFTKSFTLVLMFLWFYFFPKQCQFLVLFLFRFCIGAANSGFVVFVLYGLDLASCSSILYTCYFPKVLFGFSICLNLLTTVYQFQKMCVKHQTSSPVFVNLVSFIYSPEDI